MNKRLLPYKNFNADIFVGDYTEYAKLHLEYVNVGVIFNDKPFHNLRALHIINRNKPFSYSFDGTKKSVQNFVKNIARARTLEKMLMLQYPS